MKFYKNEKKIPTEIFFAFSNFSAKFNKADSGPLK